MFHYEVTRALASRAVGVAANGAARLARRDIISGDTVISFGDPSDTEPPQQVPPATMAVLIFTGFAGIIAMILVQYTLTLLFTLTIVEDPPAVYLPLNNNDNTPAPSSPGSKPSAPSSSPDQRQFITSSIRGTLRHLRAEAGALSPWRGLGATLALGFVSSLLRSMLEPFLAHALFFPDRLASFLASMLSMVAFARFQMVVTHIQISAPCKDNFLRRVLAAKWSDAKHTLPALILYIATVAFAGEIVLFGARPETSPQARGILAVINLAWCVLVVLPAGMVVTRVQASLLPEDVCTVVEFDRAFGEDLGDRGVLTVGKATRSLYHGRFLRRVGIFLVKTVPLSVVVCGLFIGTWVAVAVAQGIKF